MGDVVGGVVGGIGSIFGGNEAASGAKDAAKTTADASRYASDMQYKMYDQSRMDSMPYSALGATSAPLLQYLATGIMPTMTPQELDMISQYNQSMSPQASTGQPQQGQPAGPASFYDEIRARTSDDNKMANFLESLRNGWQTDGINAPNPMQTQTMNAMQAQQGTSALDLDQYALQNALAKQQAIEQLNNGWSIQTSPAYQWQQDQMTRAMNRNASTKGLSNSSAALNALGNANMALAGSEFDRSYGRLMDLTNIGRGMQTTNAGLGASAAANAGNALMSGANQAAAYNTQAANTTGSMYANAGNALGYALGNYSPSVASPYGQAVPSIPGATYGGSSNFAFTL